MNEYNWVHMMQHSVNESGSPIDMKKVKEPDYVLMVSAFSA